MTKSVAPFAPEIIWFTPSERFVRRPDHFMEAVKKGSANSGCMIGNYHGSQVDRSELRVWVMAWQSLAHQRNFMENEAYIDLILPVMEAMVGPGEITQVLLSSPSDFKRALSAPVTQFISITMRPFHDRSYELVPLLERLKEDVQNTPGCLASCWGPAVERDNVQVGIMGWTSIRDRDAAVLGPLSSGLKLIRELGKVEFRYANFAAH